MKTLVIAEKPSVALDYKRILTQTESFQDYKGYSESEQYVISYTLGHLLTIMDPGEIDASYKSWKLAALPIIPPSYPLKPIKGTESQLGIVSKLLKRKDISTVINGCDAGREGELIFRYVLEYAGESALRGKKIFRLWLQSMTTESIREAFKELKTDEEMTSLHEAARSRAEADWVVGINASRAFTAYQSKGGGFILTPCGRVQTPTLMMIVHREKEREAFVSEPYHHLTGVFKGKTSSFPATWFDKKSENSKPQRFKDRKKAEEILKKVEGKKGEVTEVQKKATQSSPLLYDLTTLQREANSRFGFSAKTTLGVIQSLYETHKLVTYPRTASKHLPEDYRGIAKNTLKMLETHPVLGAFAKRIIKDGLVDKVGKKVFDNRKISDHFAIIPTQNTPTKKLQETQQKIYLMILQRFLAVFYPPSVFLNTIREVKIEGEFFKAEGKVLLDPGYRSVFFQDDSKEGLPPLESPNIYLGTEMQIGDFMTQPPARFTESSLLSAMEGAGKFIEDEELKEAIKERGLGTPATRAAIIEKLVTDKYLVREDGAMVPTQKAFGLHRLIDAMKVEQLGSPELTGEWEYQLAKIEDGALSRTHFMGQIYKGVVDIIESIRSFNEETTLQPAGFRLFGKDMYETLSKYTLKDHSFEISKVIGGRFFAPQEILTLFENGKIGPLEGFRSRLGRPYTAILEVGENQKIQFKFDDATFSKESLENALLIGVSPIDGSSVYQTDTHYLSSSFVDGEKTGLRINRVLLGKEISADNMKKILSGEKSELIEGFLSIKKRRKFDAYLSMKEDGKLEFSFKEAIRKGRKTKPSSRSKTATVSVSPKKKTTTVRRVKATASKVKKTPSPRKKAADN